MNRISRRTIARIIELWFEGHSRDEIAEILGISGDTVSRNVDLLPESLKELRRLSVELKKYNTSVPETLRGGRLLSELLDLGLNPDKLGESIEIVKALSQEANYKPQQVVKAAAKLARLEQESGKQYPEAITEFEAKTEKVQKLNETIASLQKQAKDEEQRLEQKLKKSKTTKKQIKYITTLCIELKQYGIKLEDAEKLQNFLTNMQDAGYNPKNFVKHTRKIGSLKAAITRLEKQKQQKTDELTTVTHALKEEIKRLKTQTDNAISDVAALEMRKRELQNERDQLLNDIKTLKIEKDVQKARLEEETEKLADILKVAANVKEITKAIVAKKEELAKVKRDIIDETRRQEQIFGTVRQLNIRIETLQNELEKMLQIKDYVLQHKEAIANLENQKASLEKETSEKSERIALSDTITNFLTRQSTFDFNRFYSMVESIKRAREDKTSPLRPLIPRIEESIRMLALQAFEGDLVSKTQHEELRKIKEEYRTCCEQRDKEIKGLKGELEEEQEKVLRLENEKEVSDRIVIHVKEGDFTLRDLREWLIAEIDKEIERRKTEQFDQQAARTYGLLEWLKDAIAGKNQG